MYTHLINDTPLVTCTESFGGHAHAPSVLSTLLRNIAADNHEYYTDISCVHTTVDTPRVHNKSCNTTTSCVRKASCSHVELDLHAYIPCPFRPKKKKSMQAGFLTADMHTEQDPEQNTKSKTVKIHMDNGKQTKTKLQLRENRYIIFYMSLSQILPFIPYCPWVFNSFCYSLYTNQLLCCCVTESSSSNSSTYSVG